MGLWKPLSDVNPVCGFTLKVGKNGIHFHSPLPACHSEMQVRMLLLLLASNCNLSPISLFWMSTGGGWTEQIFLQDLELA